ncbi:DUF2789 domain-containing protein [Microbulbifer flavimaris]|uniref:DUF2789 domain-containing protein n=1 Tax=Microbulbifer flavimaris TaxID=1781068 RepID=A0ABX4HZI4_9GAMM|nr:MULTISPECIES: DUF2789 domain-containing protein [Microbulbifer]KUJ83378.1 hypothetical protein AVO43_05800 [Microbulbifer sp. ZGT114]PCO05534.1 DUF2789 domain-containing protein [Microbulbifer flavimaris]
MDTSTHHNLNDLFAQLGLASEDAAIDEFIARHHLAGDQKLAQAPFWSDGQREFLKEAIQDDSDWCEVVDELDTLLRH